MKAMKYIIVMTLSAGALLSATSVTADVTVPSLEIKKPYDTDLVGVDNFKIWLERPTTVNFTAKGDRDYDGHNITGDVAWRSVLKVFGTDITLANFKASQHTKVYDGVYNGYCSVVVVGVTRNCDSWDGVRGDSDDYHKTFLDVSNSFPVGPFPVTVRAEADGVLGFNITAEGDDNSLAVDLAPYATVEAMASAELGVPGLASAGVEGAFTIFAMDIGTKLVINYIPGGTQGHGSTTLEWKRVHYQYYTLLAGKIRPFYTLLGPDRHYGESIAESDGYTEGNRFTDNSGNLLE